MDPINFQIQKFSSDTENPKVKQITISVADEKTKVMRSYTITYCKDVTEAELADDQQFINRVSNLIRLFDAVSAAESALSGGKSNIQIKQKADGTPRVFIQETKYKLPALGQRYETAGKDSTKREVMQRSLSVINSFTTTSTHLAVKPPDVEEMTLTTLSSPAPAKPKEKLKDIHHAPAPSAHSSVEDFDDLELSNMEPKPTAAKPSTLHPSSVDEELDDIFSKTSYVETDEPMPTIAKETNTTRVPSYDELTLIKLANLAAKDKIDKKSVKEFIQFIKIIDMKPEYRADLKLVANEAWLFAQKNHMKEADTLLQFLDQFPGPQKADRASHYEAVKFDHYLTEAGGKPSAKKVYTLLNEYEKLDESLKEEFKKDLYQLVEQELKKVKQPSANVKFLFNRDELKLYKKEFTTFLVENHPHVSKEIIADFVKDNQEEITADFVKDNQEKGKVDQSFEDLFGEVSEEERQQSEDEIEAIFGEATAKTPHQDIEISTSTQSPTVKNLILLDKFVKGIKNNLSVMFDVNGKDLIYVEVEDDDDEVIKEEIDAFSHILDRFQAAIDRNISYYIDENGSHIFISKKLEALKEIQRFNEVLDASPEFRRKYEQMLEDSKQL